MQHPQFELADENRAGIGDLVRPLANRAVLRIEGRTAGQVQVRRQVDGGWSGLFLLPERYLADHGELATPTSPRDGPSAPPTCSSPAP